MVIGKKCDCGNELRIQQAMRTEASNCDSISAAVFNVVICRVCKKIHTLISNTRIEMRIQND